MLGNVQPSSKTLEGAVRVRFKQIAINGAWGRNRTIVAYFRWCLPEKTALYLYENSTTFVRMAVMRLHFHLRNLEELILDEEGSEYSDMEAAREEARASIRELAIEDIRNGKSPRGWRVQISDPEGALLETVKLEVAMAPQGALSTSQFSSLTEIGRSVVHHSIPAEDAVMLLERGMIYSLLGSFRITAAGRSRLAQGN